MTHAPTWILSAGLAARLRDSKTGRPTLLRALEDAGRPPVVVPYHGADLGLDALGLETLAAAQGPAIVCGGHPFLDAVAAAQPDLAPGIFHDPITHGHSHVAAALGPLHLNAGARAMPLAQAQDLLARNGPMFLRPEACDKTFAGGVFTPEKAAELAFDPNLVVIVAPLRRVIAEYRFFVLDAQVVTGSQYARAGRLDARLDVDPRAQDFAARAAAVFSPARLFACDVAETDEGFFVVEYNSFSSSGHYASDGRKILAAGDAALF